MRMGDVAGAVEVGISVLNELTTVSSTRTLRVLEPLRHLAGRVPAGDGFRDQFDALTQKAITP